MRKGREAEQAQDYDRAVVQYTLALKETPDSVDARASLERAKLRASQFHLNNGRRNAAAGKLEEALLEYQIAAEMNPSSSEADKELRQTRNQLRAKVAVSREGKTALETLIERTRDVPPPGLDLPSGLKLPASLVFREASSRDVYTALARFADVNRPLRPRLPRRPDHDRPPQRHVPGRRHGAVRHDPDLLPGDRPANDHHHPGHGREAPRVRGRGRSDVLPEQRRPEGDDRPAADGGRPPPHRADRRHQRGVGPGHG